MYLSSKFGKEFVLKPSSTNKFEYADERELFYASLLCNVLPEAPALIPPLSTLPSGGDCVKQRKIASKPIRLIQFAYDPPPTPTETERRDHESPSRSSIRTPPSSTVVRESQHIDRCYEI